MIAKKKKNEKDQKFLAKDLKDPCIRMNVKQKEKIKIQETNIDIFFESNFVGVNRLFVSLCSNYDANTKRFKSQ